MGIFQCCALCPSWIISPSCPHAPPPPLPIFPKDGDWPTRRSSFPAARAEGDATFRPGRSLSGSLWYHTLHASAGSTHLIYLAPEFASGLCSLAGQPAVAGTFELRAAPMPLGISPGCPAQSPAQEGGCYCCTHEPPRGLPFPTWVPWDEEEKGADDRKGGWGSRAG